MSSVKSPGFYTTNQGTVHVVEARWNSIEGPRSELHAYDAKGVEVALPDEQAAHDVEREKQDSHFRAMHERQLHPELPNINVEGARNAVIEVIREKADAYSLEPAVREHYEQLATRAMTPGDPIDRSNTLGFTAAQNELLQAADKLMGGSAFALFKQVFDEVNRQTAMNCNQNTLFTVD